MLPPHLQTKFKPEPVTFTGFDARSWSKSGMGIRAPHPETLIQEIAAWDDSVHGVPAETKMRAWLGHPDDRVLEEVLRLVTERDPHEKIRMAMGRVLPSIKEHTAELMRADGVLWTHRMGLLRRLSAGADPGRDQRYQDQMGGDVTNWAVTASTDDLAAVLDHITDPIFNRDVGQGLTKIDKRSTALLRVRPPLLDGFTLQRFMHTKHKRVAWKAGMEMLVRPLEWVTTEHNTPPLVGVMVARQVPEVIHDDDPQWKQYVRDMRHLLRRVKMDGLTPYQKYHVAQQIARAFEAMPDSAKTQVSAEFGHVPGVLRGDWFAEQVYRDQLPASQVLNFLRNTNSGSQAKMWLDRYGAHDIDLARELIDPSRTAATAAVLQHGPAELHAEAWQALLDHLPDEITQTWLQRRGKPGVLRDLSRCPAPPPWVLGAVAAKSRDSGDLIHQMTRVADLSPEHVDAILAGQVIPDIVAQWSVAQPWYLYGRSALADDPRIPHALGLQIVRLNTPRGFRLGFLERLASCHADHHVGIHLVLALSRAPEHLLAEFQPRDVVPLLTHPEAEVRQRAQLHVLPRLGVHFGQPPESAAVPVPHSAPRR